MVLACGRLEGEAELGVGAREPARRGRPEVARRVVGEPVGREGRGGLWLSGNWGGRHREPVRTWGKGGHHKVRARAPRAGTMRRDNAAGTGAGAPELQGVAATAFH